jgi:hypothetical protein
MPRPWTCSYGPRKRVRAEPMGSAFFKEGSRTSGAFFASLFGCLFRRNRRPLMPIDGWYFAILRQASLLWFEVRYLSSTQQVRSALSGLSGPAFSSLEGCCSIRLSYGDKAGNDRWSGREDSNLRPPAPKAGALPDCATPRHGSHTTAAAPDGIPSPTALARSILRAGSEVSHCLAVGRSSRNSKT